MLEEFEKIGKEALAEIKKVTDLKALEDFRIKYLARKGRIIQMLSQVGRFPPEQRPKAGQIANQAKKQVIEAFEQLKSILQKSKKKPQ